jgi:hypothetical protein
VASRIGARDFERGVTRYLSYADFPIGKSPTGLGPLTVDIGDRDSEFQIAREVHTGFAIARTPISRIAKGRSPKSPVGDENSREELEEHYCSSGRG